MTFVGLSYKWDSFFELNLSRVDQHAEKIIDSILKAAPKYSLNIDGVEFIPNGAKSLLEEVPPNTNASQKHVLLISNNSGPIGICDFIESYPDKKTGFLGLLLFSEVNQSNGNGLNGYLLIEEYAKSLGIKSIQLGVVESNPVEGFWNKMGFSRSGRSKPHKGENLESVVHVLKKIL